MTLSKLRKMLKEESVRATLGLLIVVMCASCASVPEQPRDVELVVAPTAGAHIGDPGISIRRNADGSLHSVSIDALGRGVGSASLEWSIQWFLVSGLKVDGISDRWRPLDVSPGMPFQIDAIAPRDGVARAIVQIRSR